LINGQGNSEQVPASNRPLKNLFCSGLRCGRGCGTGTCRQFALCPWRCRTEIHRTMRLTTGPRAATSGQTPGRCLPGRMRTAWRPRLYTGRLCRAVVVGGRPRVARRV